MTQKHTFSTLCLIRKNRVNHNDEAAIYLRITVDGARAEISTKQFVDPTKWKSDKGRVKGTNEVARIINHNLDMLELKAQQKYSELLAKGKPIHSVAIKNAILGIASIYRTMLKDIILPHYSGHSFEELSLKITNKL